MRQWPARGARTPDPQLRSLLLNAALMIKTTSGNAIQNPLAGIANKAKAEMVRYAAEFGMTLSARSRVTAMPDENKADPLAEFFG